MSHIYHHIFLLQLDPTTILTPLRRLVNHAHQATSQLRGVRRVSYVPLERMEHYRAFLVCNVDHALIPQWDHHPVPLVLTVNLVKLVV